MIARRVENQSVFDNDEFTNGFINFYSSPDFEKYMIPYLREMVEAYRDALESSDKVNEIQGRIKTVRQIARQADMLRAMKEDRLNNSRGQG